MARQRATFNAAMILGVLILMIALLMLSVVSLGNLNLALPRVQPRAERPPLPGPHAPVPPREDTHFQANERLQMAQQARMIIGDPNSQCDYYDCDGSSSVMRTCSIVDQADQVVYAMQWIYFNGEAEAWIEGSVWVQDDASKAERYLRNQGCIP